MRFFGIPSEYAHSHQPNFVKKKKDDTLCRYLLPISAADTGSDTGSDTVVDTAANFLFLARPGQLTNREENSPLAKVRNVQL